MIEIKTTTFLELLRQGGIFIPLIRRGYAQGRQQESVQELRDHFLEALHHALTRREGLQLDFVCGLRCAGGFIPLDGQQRLTTLFLLHWYTLEEAAEPGASEGSEPSLLSCFRYETRSTTAGFLRELLAHRRELLEGSKALGSVRAAVEDQCWYQASWSDDPSVVGMLVMLDAIEKRFKAQCRKLTPEVLERITFLLVTLNEQTDPDLLYRKINSRGRKLSAYENFKAELLQALREDAVGRSKRGAAYADFEQSLDGAWSNAVYRLLQTGGEGIVPGVVGAAEGGSVLAAVGGVGFGVNGFGGDVAVGEGAEADGAEDMAVAVDRALLNLFCGYARLFFLHRGQRQPGVASQGSLGAGDDARLRAGAYLEVLRREKELFAFVSLFRSGMEWWLTPIPHRICEEHLAARQQGAWMALPLAPPNVVTNFEGREANPFLRLCREWDKLTPAARRETLCYLYAVGGLRNFYRSLTPDDIHERLMLLRNLLNNGTFEAKSPEQLIPWIRELVSKGAEAMADPSPPEGSGFWPRQWKQEKIKLAWRKQNTSRSSDLRVLDHLENHDLLRGDASLAISDGAYRPDLAAALLRVLPQEGEQKLRQCALLTMACALTSPLVIKGTPPKYLLYQTDLHYLRGSLRAASDNKGLKKNLRELLDALGDRDLGAYLDSFVDEKAGLDSRSYLIRYRAAVFRLILPRAAGSAAPLREAWPECFYDFGKDKSAPTFASLRLRKQQTGKMGSTWFRLLPELIRCLCAEGQEDRVRVDETSAEGDTLLIAPTAAGEGEGCGVSLRCRRDAFVMERPGKSPVAIPIRRSVSEGESRDVVDRVLLGCAVVRAILRPCEAGKCQLSGKPGESCSLKLPTYDAASGRLGAGSGPELALKLTAAKVSKKA